LQTLDQIKEEAGQDKVDVSLGFVGVQPSSYPINTIYLWTGGPEEAVLQVQLKRGSGIRVDDLKERLRSRLAYALPSVRYSFEAGDIVSRVMSFGANTPVEIDVNGPSLKDNRSYADQLKANLSKISSLSDLQFGQALDYPTLQVNLDRERAGILGVTMNQFARSAIAVTASSRYVTPNYWADPKSGIAYQVQVEIPQKRMNSTEELADLPISSNAGTTVLLRDMATVTPGTAVGEYDRYNMQRTV